MKVRVRARSKEGQKGDEVQLLVGRSHDASRRTLLAWAAELVLILHLSKTPLAPGKRSACMWTKLTACAS